MKKSVCTMIGILFVLVLGACGSQDSNSQDIKEMVHDYSTGTFDDVTASITSEELIVTNNDGKETFYNLPEDEFFVSIAPFVDTTHDCAVHSLTGCQGELMEKEVDISVEDEDGNVIMDEATSTFENGFIDLWLPRDNTYQVNIEYDGKKATSEVSTFKGDKTCITTMQLI